MTVKWREEGVVSTDAGQMIAFNHCVLVTGSDAMLPAYMDTSIPGVFMYRNIGDVNSLLAYVEWEGTKDVQVSFEGEDVSPTVVAGGAGTKPS